MSTLPHYSKRKAETISTGLFLVLLGLIFYTDQWWPGILFAIGLSYASREYLTGKRLNLFFTLIALGILGFFTLAGHLFSGFFPFILVAAGLYLVAKETLLFKGIGRNDKKEPPER